jgi:TonB family protein
MLTPDTILQNRYRIVGKLGQGGMGTVYEAVDQRLYATIALKECVITNEHLQKQFEKEARMLAQLSHPALTKVFDYFVEDDKQFLIMEFVPGEDLWTLILKQRTPFPINEVLSWADQLLDALDYLHSQTPPIIHRDIKPHNLKLTGRGQIKLLDFGLAKGATGSLSNASAAQSVFGYTLNYAALEQIQGTGTDPRSDLYSLAATLYHLLTASMPSDALMRITEVANERPDPLHSPDAYNPQIMPALSSLLMQALSHNREKRPTSAIEMRQAIRLITTHIAKPRNTDQNETLKLNQSHLPLVPPQNSSEPVPTEIMHGAVSREPQTPQTNTPIMPSLETVQQKHTTSPEQRQQTNPKVAAQQMFLNKGAKRNWSYTFAAASLFSLLIISGIGLIAFYGLYSSSPPSEVANANVPDGKSPDTFPTVSSPVNTSNANVSPSPSATITPKPKERPTPEKSATPVATKTKPTPMATPITTPNPKPTPVLARKPPTSNTKPVVLSKPQPNYPPEARKANVSGTVVVQVVVDESGNVISARAVSGHPLLKESAVKAAYRARFSPATVDGKPVKSRARLQYTFNLN